MQHKPKPGLIFHSDRGIQYACKEFRELLKKNNIIQSMSRRRNCWDNAVAESFFKTLKVERVYHRKYMNEIQTKSDLFKYIEIFYNRKRLHSSLNYTNPVDYKKRYLKQIA
jgi:putative transposase